MDTLLQDLRYSVRKLRSQPLLSVTVVLCLAVGIGANTAMFSVVHAALLRPLPMTDAGRLVTFYDTYRPPGDSLQSYRVSPPNFVAWEHEEDLFERLAASRVNFASLTGNFDPRRVQIGEVTADLFSTLGVRPSIGRTFTAEEDRTGQPAPVVLLSHRLWRRQFGADDDLVGRSVLLDGVAHTVIGVMPEGFQYPEETSNPGGVELWRPLGLDPEQLPQRLWHNLLVVGRLAPGVTVDRAGSAMATVAARMEQARPETNSDWGVDVVPLREDLVGDYKPTLSLLFVAVGLVLLISCVNVANLLLFQAADRGDELALRTAIGASPRRLARQILTESLMLSALGGVTGLVLAHLSLRPLVALIPSRLSVFDEVAVNPPVLAFTLASSLVAGVLFGALPALRSARPRIAPLLAQGSTRTSGGRLSRRLQSTLVVAEVGLVTLLLIVAGLTMKRFGGLLSVDPGLTVENVLTLGTPFSPDRYPEVHQRVAFLRESAERLEALPGVTDVAITSALPFGDAPFKVRVSVENRSPETQEEVLAANHRLVSPDFFEMVGMRLLSGRRFSSTDHGQSAPVAIVSQAMAERYWPGRNPVGQRIKRGGPDSDRPWRRVVGVVEDVRDAGLDVSPEPTWYLPYSQSPFPNYYFAIRTEADPMDLVATARETIWSIDPDQPLFDVRTLESVMLGSVAGTRFRTVLLGLFGTLATLLVAAGIYGVMSQFIRRRLREFGIRMALGAEGGSILRMVLRQGIALTAAGLAGGLLGAAAVTRRFSETLLQVPSLDPGVLALISAFVLALGATAVALPALRATRIDPVTILKSPG